MPDESHDALAAECSILCRHLVGRPSDEYVTRKYVEAHAALPALAAPTDALDRALLRVAGAHPYAARVVDLYARFFAPRALVRAKAVVLLAILECSPSTHGAFDRREPASRLRVIAGVAAQGLLALPTLLLGVLLLAPVHGACRLAARAERA